MRWAGGRQDKGQDMKLKRKAGGQVAGMAALALLLCACGGPAKRAAAEAGTETASRAGAETPGEAREPARRAGPVNAFSFEETGVAMRQTVPAPEELMLAGGCTGDSPINLSIFLGRPMDERWFNVAFVTEGAIAPGETGSFPLQSLQWDDGVMRPENLPADSPARAPVRYSGKGTLTLEMHMASTQTRRMAGTLTGHVEQFGKGPAAADITAHFDINFSCGVK